MVKIKEGRRDHRGGMEGGLKWSPTYNERKFTHNTSPVDHIEPVV